MSVPNRSAWRLRSLLILSLLALLAVGVYLGHLKGLLHEGVRLRFETTSAAHLFEGMKITYKGFEIGKLRELELTPEGQVRGQLQINQDYEGFLTAGSVFKLSKEKIVTSELVLLRDEGQRTPLDRQLPVLIQRDDLAADLNKRLEPLLQKFQAVLSQVADPQDGLQANLRQSRKVMEHTVATLAQTTQVMRMMADPQEGFGAVMQQTRQTLRALEPTTGEATRTLVQATSTLKELEQTLAHSRQTMDSAEKLLREVDQVTQDVQSAPIYRWLVPKRKTAPTQAPPQPQAQPQPSAQ